MVLIGEPESEKIPIVRLLGRPRLAPGEAVEGPDARGIQLDHQSLGGSRREPVGAARCRAG